MRGWPVLMLALLAPAIFGLFVAVAAAPQPARRPSVTTAGPPARPESGELRTYRALQKRISIQLQDEPLTAVVKELSSRGGFNCLLDPRALQESGVSPDVKIRVNANDVRLGTLLDQILTPLGLDFVVNNETVKITNRQRAKGDLVSATYPIGDLAMRLQNGKNATDEQAVQDLIETITSTVSPESWTANDGPGSVTFSEKNVSLVVRQTAGVQRDIQSLLVRLRRGRTAPAAARSSPPPRPNVTPAVAESQEETP